MAVEIPPGYLLAAWEMRYPGDPDPWYCTCGFEIVDGPGDPVVIANSLQSAWIDTVLNTQSTLMTLQGCVVKIGNDGAPIMGYSSQPAAPGGTAQLMLPQNCALLVDKLTATGGRRSRGRFYVPGCLVEGNVDNIGVIETSLMTTLTAEWTAFMTYVQAAGPIPSFNPVILHSPSGPEVVEPTPTGEPTPVTSFRVQSVISTQRKRLR